MYDIVTTVLALAGLLGLVSLLLPLAERLGVPYAVLLAGAGCAIGALSGVGDTAAPGIVGDVLDQLGQFHMTADAFLYIFLPVLLFETALGVDVRALAEEILLVLVLAVLGVVVCTGMVGAALWAASGISVLACLMLGAILATTDPVAVIAIFRDIGAPRRLSVLVEGESLFNDAAAIALFALLLGQLTGSGEMGAAGAILDFLVHFIGGLAAGWAAGRLGCLLLPLLRDHGLAERTLTLALPYIVFVVSERYIHVSGVVAVVAAGLVVNAQGRRQLSPGAWESLHKAWEQIGFWASSLIFLLAAMMVPELLAGTGWRDAGLLGVLVLSALAARAVTLWGLMPLLSLAGLAQRVADDFKIVILWGGMRGAVSLALALAAVQNPQLDPGIRRFVAILATGFVLFTLFVSAPTLRPLMRLLRLDVLSPAETALRDRVTALSLSEIGDDLAEVARAHGIDAGVLDAAARRYRRHAGAATELAEENAQIPEEARLRSALEILVEREQEFYLEYFGARTMSRRAVAFLIAQAGAMREAVRQEGPGAYAAAAGRLLAFPRSFRLALRLHRRLGLEGWLARQLADRFEILLAARVVLRSLTDFSGRELQTLFGAGVGERVREAIEQRRNEVDQALAALALQYPNYARDLQGRFLRMTALRIEEERYRHLRGEAIIGNEVHADLMRDLIVRRKAAERRPRLDLDLDRGALVARVSLFAGLGAEQQARIARMLRPLVAVPGQRILRRGDRGDTMYFVASGAVEVRIEPRPIRLGSGDFFGEIALLTQQPRVADVVALGYCNLLSLSHRDLQTLFAEDAGLKREIYATARQRLAPQLAE